MQSGNTVIEGDMRKGLEELGERIAEQAAHIDAALHRLLTDLREFDAKGGWFQAGATSAAHWLSWRVGWDLGTGREHVRVAKRLGELPLVDDALRRGALSYSKVRAITRVATPAIEQTLVEWAALTTAAQLERICRKFRTVQLLAGSTETEPPRRYVAKRDLDDGMVRIEVVVRPDEAAMVWSAMEAAGKDVSAEAQTAGFDRVEGLLALAQGRLRGDRPERTSVEVVVTVDRTVLESSTGDVATGGTAAVGVFADGTCVSAETARRLTCDAAIVEIVECEGIPIDVGRKTRTISTALFRALVRRDVTCRFPGCCNRGYVEGHHVVHWAKGGETNLANLLLLCSHHHAFLHEHGFRVEMGADQVPEFFDPRGRSVLEAPPRWIDHGWGAATLAAANAAASAANRNVDEEITADTNRCGWDGQPVDYGLCVNGLWQANGRR